MKRKKQPWPPIRKRKGWDGKVNWLVDLGIINGKRVRKSFSTKTEADDYAQEERVKRNQEGLAAYEVTADIRIEAGKCVQKLKPYNASLTEAVDFYVKHFLAYREAPVITKAIDDFLLRKQKKRQKTIDSLEYRLGKFSEVFGEKQLANVTADEFEKWITALDLAVQTKAGIITAISELYKYGIKKKWVEFNITELILRPDPSTESDEKEIEIFSVDDAAKVLSNASKYRLLPYVAIGLFAGLRSNELARLDWTNVKFSERAIIVSGQAAKKRSRRVVEINDTLALWLADFTNAKGPIVPNPKTLHKRVKRLRKKAGLTKWPLNGLRHSFGSYFFARYGDAVRAAKEMGNSPDVFHSRYKGLVLKSEAETYWNLTPENASNIIVFKKAS